MKTLQLDIVSDIACPWCAIGLARLEGAQQQLSPELRLDIHWRPFELDPDPNLVPTPILPALVKKYGRSEAEMQQSQLQLQQIASDLGLNFSKLQQRFTCNTFDAHRLVHWAGLSGQATALKKALFEAYFGEGLAVSEPEVLLDAVTSAGLDRAAAEAVLKSGQYSDEVRAEQQHYLQAGIQSVPAFIVNQQYLISGAQDTPVLVQALQQIAAKVANGANVANTESP
jgi:predicted DsbA family dithiol-disulfide isomerase